MNRRQGLLLPAALASACSPPNPVADAATLGGCQGQGHPGLGRGFHLGNVFGRTLEDFRLIAATGATLVRFGIELVVDKTGQRYQTLPPALPELMRQLDFARATGLKLVPVLRPEPYPESPLWVRPALQDSLDALWRTLAQQLRGRPEVAAFDLVNEAHPPGLTFAMKQARWERLAERLLRSVREVDPTRTIVIEPSPGARPMGFPTASRLPFDNVVYSVHMYEPFEFTHQRVGDARFTGVVGYPGLVPDQGHWDRERLRAEMAPVQQFGQKHGVEIYVGEFGAPRWAPDGSRERYLGDLLSLFNEWGWSWTYHAWREWQGWDAEMGPNQRVFHRNDSEPAFRLLREALKTCKAPHEQR